MREIGFIGLGIMGLPMASNLLKAGFRLTIVRGHARTAVKDLAKAGAAVVDTPREVAAATEVVVTCLPDTPDVCDVVAGPNGLLDGAKRGLVIVDHSTIAPMAARRLAEDCQRRGVAFLDAPVSGGQQGAIAGTLSIMVGGEPASFERALPILQAMGKTIVHVGPAGSGQVVKCCNQVVVAVVLEAVSEALVLGSKAGVEPARIVEVLQGGLASTRVLEMRAPNMLSGSFDPGFRIRLHLKDLKNALELAREIGVPLPATVEVEQLMQAARVAGREDFDHSGLITVIEDLAAHRISGASA